MKKKLLLLLMAIMAAMPSLWADTYVNIQGEFNNWGDNGIKPVNGKTTHTGLSIGNGRFQVKVWDGSADHYYANGNIALNTSTKITTNNSNMYISGAKKGQKFNVQWNNNTNEIYISPVVYVIGDNVSTSSKTLTSWGNQETDGIEMKYEGDGIYTLNDVALGSFALTACLNNSWDDMNAFRFGPSTDNSAAVVGDNATVFGQDRTWSSPGTGTYNLRFDYPSRKLTITNASGEPVITKLYLRGTMNDWGTNMELETTDGDTYTLDKVNMAVGSQFKISDDGWADANTYTNNGTIMLNQSYSLKSQNELGEDNRNNMIMGEDATNAKVTFVKSTKKLTIEGVSTTKMVTVFLDLSGVNWSNPNCYVWISGTENKFNNWPGGAMTNVSGSIWKFTFPSTFDMVIFNNGSDNSKQTVDLAVTDGKTYKIVEKNGKFVIDNSSSTTVSAPDRVDDGNIYFNAGADFYAWLKEDKINTTEDNIEGWAFFWTYVNAEGNSDAQAVKMERITDADTPMFMVRDWRNNVSNADELNGVSFKFVKKDIDESTKKRFYLYDNPGDCVMYHGVQERLFGHNDKDNDFNTKDLVQPFDTEHWYLFIYGTANNNMCVQSYLSYNQYEFLRERRDADGLYFIGKNIKVLDENGQWNETGDWDCFDNMPKDSSDDDGLYIVSMLASKDAAFKVSYINPAMKGVEALKFEGNTNNKSNRWWATFNLGIVGADDNAYYKTSATATTITDGKAPYKLKDDDANKTVNYIVGHTIKINHYNQYNWYPRLRNTQDYTEGSDLGGVTRLYMVIDTHKDYYTAALLPFDPTPSIESGGVNLEHVNFFDANDARTHFAIENSSALGDGAYYQMANLISTTASLTSADVSRLDESDQTAYLKQYTAEYHLSYEGKSGKRTEIGTLDGTTGDDYDLTIPSIIADGSDDGNLRLRAIYTDAQSYDGKNTATAKNLKFRSRVDRSKVEGLDIQFEGLEFQEDETNYSVHNIRPGETEVAKPSDFDVAIGLRYKFPEGNHYTTEEKGWDDLQDKQHAVVYPSVVIDGKKDAEYEIMGENHPYIVARDEARARDNGESVSEEFSYTYPTADLTDNWSTASAESCEANTHGFFPLNVMNVVNRESFLGGEKNAVVTGKLVACYPFIIYNKLDVSKTQGASLAGKPRRAPQLTAGSYQVRVVTEETPFTVVAELSNLSGVNNVLAAPAGDEEMLFNLQGVRVVDANPAPGVYVRRAADGSVSKVLVK